MRRDLGEEKIYEKKSMKRNLWEEIYEKRRSMRRATCADTTGPMIIFPHEITKLLTPSSPRRSTIPFHHNLFQDRRTIRGGVERGSVGRLIISTNKRRISRRLSAKYRVEKRRAIGADHCPMTARHWHAHSRNSYSRLL